MSSGVSLRLAPASSASVCWNPFSLRTRNATWISVGFTPVDVAPPLSPVKEMHGGEYGSPGTWSLRSGQGRTPATLGAPLATLVGAPPAVPPRWPGRAPPAAGAPAAWPVPLAAPLASAPAALLVSVVPSVPPAASDPPSL